MKSINQFLKYRVFSVFVILSMLMSGASFHAAAKNSSPEPLSNLSIQQKENQCLGADGRVSRNASGMVNFVGASSSQSIKQPIQGLQSASPEAAARGYLSECGSLFGMSNPSAELALKSQKRLQDGRSVVRFQQMEQGIPVFGGEALMQLNAANDVLLVNASVAPGGKLDVQPSVDAASAQQTALQLTANLHQVGADSLQASAAELWVYNPTLLGFASGESALVWRVEVTPLELAPIRELVLVDAHKGSVALNINQVDTAKNRLTYTANNGTTRPGTLVCNEADSTCALGDADAKAAHKFAGETYDFYSTYHSRDSIDNAGMDLVSTVHYDSNYCNAFWDGAQMTYGDGCTSSIVTDDVVAHELTHGVTEYESGLVYAYQSGAINESFSDIWGEFVDLTNSSGDDTVGVKWLMGEDVQTGGIRDMQDPTVFGDPDRMGSPYYYTGSLDNGGVHTNSGVGNKNAYLIVDGSADEVGGMFNGYTITGIGIPKAARIYYEAQTNILTSNSNYRSLYDALNQACSTLTGSYGIIAADCTQVDNAGLATEINTVDPLPSPPANDSFSSPRMVTSVRYTNSVNTISATTASNDPSFACVSGQKYNTVWYRFTPTTSGTLSVDTFGSNYDTVLAVWQGSSPTALTSRACNDDTSGTQSKVTLNVTAGQLYRIEVAGYSGGGNLTLHVNLLPRPISPTGTITDRTPTYKWIKVAGATQYQYQLLKGTATVYTKTVSSSVCGTTTCAKTPTNLLAYAAYKWRVRAMVGGVWMPYSAFKTFTVAVGGFNSQFTSNAAGWTPVRGAWSVVNGNYLTSGIYNKVASSAYGASYPTLTYQAKMRRVGCTICVNSLYFRGTQLPVNAYYDWYKGFRFSYTNTGKYQLIYMNNGAYLELKPFTYSSAINQGGLNTLKVTANGSFLQFYINNVRVLYGTFTGFATTGKVGLAMYNFSASDKLFVDWATLSATAPASFSGLSDEGFTFDADTLSAPKGNPNVAP